MKTLLLSLLMCGPLLAADPPASLSPEKQAEALKAMLAVSSAQSAIAQADAQYLAQQQQRRQELERRGRVLEELMEKLREEHGAEGCELTTDATWRCPEPEKQKE